MATTDNIDDVVQRVAIAALAYYPTVATDEPGYELSDDVAWCMHPLVALEPQHRARLAVLVGQTIADPSRYRQALFGAVLELIPA